MMSAQSNTSFELFRTDSAPAETFDWNFTVMSAFPAGMPGMFIFDHSGLRTSWTETFGVTDAILYGPTPGGGADDRFFIAVPEGTMPSGGIASTFSSGPYGATSLIVILPVASSVVMPEIVLAL